MELILREKGIEEKVKVRWEELLKMIGAIDSLRNILLSQNIAF